MEIIMSTSSSVMISPMQIKMCLISLAPMKLLLSKSMYVNAARISAAGVAETEDKRER